ncbi:hypothetical protein POL68_26360 [Stigmatella sp. ncwal1]|uniref:Uncharacterized protein n=1 Tax=Stigmatella ashevillensis TaxID=2995309 RepID=A0ABT5DEB5_9BACT|nr:hypothetical protein [Stigmatella ashevillena]MDC0712019.1 hypothetical protein [Stigmatella ashevillena]
MPTHNDLVANTPAFLQNYAYCSHGANCLAMLNRHATFLTHNGNAAGLVAPANIPAVTPLAVAAVIQDLAAEVVALPVGGGAGGTDGRTWFWFNAVNNPANHPMTWGLLPAHVKSDFQLFANNPGGGGLNTLRRAYFLPYRQNGITHVTLGNDADFCFTAPLGGCTVYIWRPAVGPPQFFHANAGDVADVPVGNKQAYMDHMFQAVTGVPAAHATVTAYRSANVGLNTVVNPGLTTEVVRKFFMGRHNFQWLLAGANVMGRRTGHNAWTLYFQTVRVLGYDRFALVEAARALTHGEAPRNLHVNKLQTLTVHASGVV